MLCRNLCKLVLIVSSAVQIGAEWRDQGQKRSTGSLLDVAQGQGTERMGSAQGKGVRDGISPSRPRLNCSSFGPGLCSFKIFFPSEVALWRRGKHPALLPAPFWVTLSSFGSYGCSFSFVQQPMPPPFLLTLL